MKKIERNAETVEAVHTHTHTQVFLKNKNKKYIK